MKEILFWGKHNSTFDEERRRIVIPKIFVRKFRGKKAIITSSTNNSYFRLFPVFLETKIVKKVSPSEIWEIPIDNQRRVVIPKELNKPISSEVLWVGQGTFLELRLRKPKEGKINKEVKN